MKTPILFAFVFCGVACAVFGADKTEAVSETGISWSPVAAGKYLDARETWWQNWPNSQRDHNTVCISCHSALPYALARPSLRRDLKEDAPSNPEQFLLAGVSKRVSLWNEVEPFYSDAKQGPPKTAEARGTESVLNALILSSKDDRLGHLTPLTKAAFDALWSLQLKSGDKAGAWTWLNFHLAPWESVESQYYGAAMAALAVGTAPDHYASQPAIQDNLTLLKSFLLSSYDRQPLLNRVAVLWASAKWPGLLTPEQTSALSDAIFLKQRNDGGWALSALGDFKRMDDTATPTVSDGYATGLIVLAMEGSGTSRHSQHLSKAIDWLQQNQDKVEGSWPAASVNKRRDPAIERGKFMTDAASAFAVLALENSR